MLRGVKISFVALALTLSWTGCQKDPTFPITPAIQVVSIIETENGKADVRFSFTDGDGDIGWANTSLAGTRKDIIMDYQEMVDGEWLSLENFDFEFFMIPDLTPVGQDKFLEGEISVDISFPPNPTSLDSDSIRFGVILRDRAGHLSELVFSPLYLP